MPGVRRLKKRREFLNVAAARRKWVTPGFVLQVLMRSGKPASEEGAGHESLPGPAPDDLRIGFTVSRKVGKAVTRNRARRRLRAAAAEVLPRAGRAGRDYVLIGRSGTLTVPFADLVRDLELSLTRVEAKNKKERSGPRPRTAKGDETRCRN